MADDAYWSSYSHLLTAEHLAKILRIGVPAVHARLRVGRIPAHRIGRSWVVFTAEVRAWLAENSNRRNSRDPLPDTDLVADYPDELSYRDLMRLFGKTKPTIYIWLNNGTIPASNFGGRWVILKPALEDMLRTTKITPPPSIRRDPSRTLYFEHVFEYGGVVGTNRRYPSRVADTIGRRIEQVVTRPEPISLSDAELDKPNTVVTTAATPIPVRAWVRFPETPIRTTARAVAWTRRAVLVEWETVDARTVRAWVWASAVERITANHRPP